MPVVEAEPVVTAKLGVLEAKPVVLEAMPVLLDDESLVLEAAGNKSIQMLALQEGCNLLLQLSPVYPSHQPSQLGRTYPGPQ